MYIYFYINKYICLKPECIFLISPKKLFLKVYLDYSDILLIESGVHPNCFLNAVVK